MSALPTPPQQPLPSACASWEQWRAFGGVGEEGGTRAGSAPSAPPLACAHPPTRPRGRIEATHAHTHTHSQPPHPRHPSAHLAVVGGVLLVGLLVGGDAAVGRARLGRRGERVAEGPIKGRGILCCVGHDGHLGEALGVQRAAFRGRGGGRGDGAWGEGCMGGRGGGAGNKWGEVQPGAPPSPPTHPTTHTRSLTGGWRPPAHPSCQRGRRSRRPRGLGRRPGGTGTLSSRR